jgi:hypothetical protein
MNPTCRLAATECLNMINKASSEVVCGDPLNLHRSSCRGDRQVCGCDWAESEGRWNQLQVPGRSRARWVFSALKWKLRTFGSRESGPDAKKREREGGRERRAGGVCEGRRVYTLHQVPKSHSRPVTLVVVDWVRSCLTYQMLRHSTLYYTNKGLGHMGSQAVSKIGVFNALQPRFGPSKYTSLKTALPNATPNWKWRHLLKSSM